MICFARQSRSPSSRPTQIRDPQPQPGGRQDHRVVAFAGGGPAVDPGQHPADLIRGPQVRLGLVTDVPVRRQPIRQAARCPARRGQEVQEVGQARPHGRDGLASQSTLTQQEARHVPHAERREIIDAHLDQVGQEPAGRPVFRDHGRLGVAATTARSEVVVPERAEPRRTTVLRRDHRPVNVDRPAGQHVRHQHHRPTNRLDIPVFDRLTQRPQPDPGLVRDEVDAHPLARRVHAATRQEGREPVQHDLLATDRVLGPAQHRATPPRRGRRQSLTSASPMRITSSSGSGMNRQAILRRCAQRSAAPRASPRRL